MSFSIITNEGYNIPFGTINKTDFIYGNDKMFSITDSDILSYCRVPVTVLTIYFKALGDRLTFSNGAYIEAIQFDTYSTYNSLVLALFSSDGTRVIVIGDFRYGYNVGHTVTITYGDLYFAIATNLKSNTLEDFLVALDEMTGYPNYYPFATFQHQERSDKSNEWIARVRLSISQAQKAILISCFEDAKHENDRGPISGTGGGTGTFDLSSDAIDFPGLPTLSAVSTGLVTVFRPDVISLNNLAAFLWSDLFDVATFKKLFANPMDALLGLSIVPCEVPSSSTANVKIGYVDTGVNMSLADTQYVAVDCGSLTPKEYWGSALDYAPYSKFAIYLPYIGTHQISTDEIMGKELHVMYHIDILSGTCTAMVKSGESVLYEWSGSCGSGIPITNQNFSQFVTTAVQLAGAGVAVAATGGASAPVTAGAVRGMAASTAEYTAANVSSIKPRIEHTGAVSGSAGMLGVQVPYLIWELPNQSLAEDYNHFVGYPSNITSTLGSLSGYTRVENVQLYGIDATDNELTEIENLLIEGVII